MISRRHFLQSAAAWSSMVALGEQANAQTVSDYKALVCVFLYGGNDTFNTVLATDTNSWSAYTTVRNQQPSPIALLANVAPDLSKSGGTPEWLGGVLPLTPSVAVPNRSLALHPSLTKVAGLFNTSRRVAIVANVGPLVQPVTKAQYLAVAASGASSSGGINIPKKLFSHNDQQNTWQAFAPEGATMGWGGLMTDQFVSGASPNAYASISLGGNAVWLSGKKVNQYQMTANGAVSMGGTSVFGSTAVGSALKRIASNGLTGPGASGSARTSHVLMADLGVVGNRSITAESGITSAFTAMPATDARVGPASRLNYNSLFGGTFTNPLAAQLQAVARVIAGRSTLGAGRQVFLVQMGGFDTHDNQNVNHTELMLKLDHALAYFDDTLGLLGVQNQVTTFTASDFGRTFTSNGDGTDHGWGAHHFVMGGAVQGGKVFGSFPTLGLKNTANNAFDSSPDQLANGALLPTTSVDQLGATLAAWFGVTAPDTIFPNLKNFSVKNLGFLA
jgi:uncharacterized protein (DUF1501 family)